GNNVARSLFRSQREGEACALSSIQIPCKRCRGLIGFEDILEGSVPFGSDELSQHLAVCGNSCVISDSEESAVLFGNKWVCFSCCDVCDRDAVWDCPGCGSLVTGDTPQAYCLACSNEFEEFEDEQHSEPPSDHVM